MPNLRDQFYIADHMGPVNYVFPTLRSQFFVTTRYQVGTQVVVRETFAAGDRTVSQAFVHVLEQFQAKDRVHPRAFVTRVVRERFRALDRVWAGERSTAQLADQLFAADRLNPPTIRATLSDSFRAGEHALPGLTSRRTIRETFKAHGQASPHRTGTLRDQFFARDGYSFGTDQRRTVRDSFVAAGRAHPFVNGYALVRDRFTATDTARPTSILRERIREQATFITTVHGRGSFEFSGMAGQDIPLEATDAWTADMLSWGMSRHVGLRVSQFIGTQFGVGEEGIFTTAENHPMAFIRTGEITLSTEERVAMEKKRINYVYAYAAQASPLKLAVSADYNGTRLTTEYTQENRPSTDTRAVRTQVGRGYASNYIQLAIGRNTAFDITGLEVEATITGRRI